MTNSSWAIPSRSGWLVIIGFALVSLLLFSPTRGSMRPLSAPTNASQTPTPLDPCSNDDDCADNLYCNGRELCRPGAAGADSRGCIAPSGPPCPRSGYRCDETTQRCTDLSCVDADGDGHYSLRCPAGDDCDDHDRNRFPGNTEVCDPEGHDEDCDPSTYYHRDRLSFRPIDGDIDADGDIDSRCCNRQANGAWLCGADYDDKNPAIRLGSMVCDGADAVVVLFSVPVSIACPPETKCVVQPNQTGICMVPPASYTPPGRFVPLSSPANLPALGTLLSPETVNPTGAGQASAKQPVDNSVAVARVIPAETVSASGSAAEVAQCKTILQSGKVSWGGGTSWAPENIDKLCNGTKNAKNTIACFQSNVEAMGWAAAIKKCK